MDLRPSALRALREAMLERGARDSLVPQARRSASVTPLGPSDIDAVIARVAPTCEALYLLIMSDGQRDPREYMALRGAIRALTDGALGTRALDDLLAKFNERVAHEGRDRRLAQVAAELSADRADAEATFMLGAAVVLIDESVDQREQGMLDELGDSLGISHKRRRELLRPDGEAM